MGGVWGAEWNMVGALATVSRKNEIFYNNGNHLHVRNGLVWQFKSLTVFAAMACALECAVLVQLYVHQHQIGAQAKAASSEGGLAMEPLLASAKVVQMAAQK